MERIPVTPIGEDAEPYWRNHDSSLFYEAEWNELHSSHPHLFRPPEAKAQRDPDWDDSHWFLGEHYWLGREYHKQSLWKSAIYLLKPHRPDSVIRDEVRDALDHDPDLESLGIKIEVESGHVTLFGFVFDSWMKEQAEEAVYFLPGVMGVNNDLEIQPFKPNPFPNTITAREERLSAPGD